MAPCWSCLAETGGTFCIDCNLLAMDSSECIRCMTSTVYIMVTCPTEDCEYHNGAYRGALCKEIKWCQCAHWEHVRMSMCYVGHRDGPLQPFHCAVGNGDGFRLYDMENQNTFTRRMCMARVAGDPCHGSSSRAISLRSPRRQRQRRSVPVTSPLRTRMGQPTMATLVAAP
jgi:hypothetical protein